GRHDAERRAGAAFPGPPALRAALALGRHALREDVECLARQPRRATRRGARGAGAGSRPRGRESLAAALAHLLHGLRRALRVPARTGMVGEPLPVRAAGGEPMSRIVAVLLALFPLAPAPA